MKYSEYNSNIDITENSSIIYNALSDKFLIIPTLKKRYLENLDSLRLNDSSLFDLLIDGGIIIENNINELDVVKKMREKVDLDDSSFQLIINPTLNCNFKCWYCYETHTKSMMNNQILENTKKFIEKTIKGKKEITLGFFGGEPLLGFNKIVKPLILFTKDICQKNNINFNSTFTTNGYLLNEKLILFLKDNNLTSMQITLDGGENEHNKTRFLNNGRGSYDKIIKNIKLLLSNNITVLLRINYTNDNILSCTSITNDLKDLTIEMKSRLHIFFQKVWQSNNAENTDEYVGNMISFFNQLGLKTNTYIFDNVRQSCYADKKNSLIINYNGNIYKCTAVDFEMSTRDGYLDNNGNVNWENNSLEERLDIKFKNKPCLTCRILPICNGSCSQKALKYKDRDYCILEFNEKEKDDAILERFRSNIILNPNWKRYFSI